MTYSVHSAFRSVILTAAVGLLMRGVAWADVDLSMQEVATGVYVHQGVHQLPDKANHGEIANVGFIVGERCVAVIDTGGSLRQGLQLRRAIKAITPLPVCYVINTHMHPDHVYGNLAFQESGVTFVGHYKLPVALATRAPFYREMATRDMAMELTPEHFIVPTLLVKDQLHLDLGGRNLTLVAHGTAHTDNDLSVQDGQTGILWLSDLLFVDHVPVIDGSLSGWLRELEKISAWRAPKAIPGHGPVAVDWPACLSREVAYLSALRAELKDFVKSGKTLEQAISSAGQSLRADWRLFDDFHKRNVSVGFAELEWED